MSKFSRDTDVLVGKKQLKVEEILKSMIYLPAPKVLEFFSSIGLTVPRELRIFVLRENLREKVAETRKSRLTLADELNYRLSWFTEFTETQLENLLIFFNDQVVFKKYLEDLWTDLLGYMVEKQVPNFDLEKLYNQALDHVKANKLVLPQIAEYNYGIKDLFYDSFGRIDGVSPNKIRNVLYKSSTLTEIRDLGHKFDVDIPRRLKKNELAEIIVKELKDNGSYTEDLEKQVKSMSVIVMQRFAIDHNIKASTELKKEEVIEYILKNAKETKETYFVPNSRDVYEKEMNQTEEEQPKEEPKVEEKIAEEVSEASEDQVAIIIEEEKEPEIVVEEEPQVDEEVSFVETKVVEVSEKAPKVEYVQSNLNFDALVDEVKKLRVAVENFEIKATKEDHMFEVVDKEEKTTDGTPKVEVINTAEYYGTDKAYKQLVKTDENLERELFVEKHKVEKQTESESNVKKEIPAELRVTGKVLKFLLKFLGIVLAIALVLLLIYSALDFFIQWTAFDSITSSINQVKLFGNGAIEWLFKFWDLFFTQNTN